MVIVIAGTIPLESKDNLELLLIDEFGNEAIHVSLNGRDKLISIWGVSNGETFPSEGMLNDETTIENGEPFVLT